MLVFFLHVSEFDYYLGLQMYFALSTVFIPCDLIYLNYIYLFDLFKC